MADYELGNAHGNIEIESDVDVEGVERSLSRIERSVQAMANRFERAERAMESFERKAQSVQRAAVAVATGIATATRSFASFSREAAQIAGTVTRVNKHFVDLRDGAKAAASGVLAATQALSDLTSLTGALGAFGKMVSGLSKDLENLPEWAKGFMKAQVALATLTATFARFGGLFGGAMSNFTSGATRVNLLARAANTASPMLRRMFGSLAVLSAGMVAANARFQTFAHVMGLAFPQLDRAYNGVRRMGPAITGMNKALQGVTTAIIGFTLLSSGLRDISKYATLAARGLGAVGVAAAAIVPISGLITGVVDSVMQLSGAFLMLPGIVATGAIAMGVLKVGLKGLTEAFKAGAGDPAAFEEAIKNLPEGMQNVARSVQGFRQQFKDLSGDIQETMFAGLSQDIKVLGESYMPTLRDGSLGVAQSLNNAKDSLVRFLQGGNQVTDLGRIFTSTEGIINNFSGAIYPALIALKDLSVVGADAFDDLTQGIGASATAFSFFIADARETGKLRGWIDDGIQGFRDLFSAVGSVGQGMHALFEALGGDGANSLERLAAAAEKFETYMTRSAQNGTVKDIADRLKDMGSNTFDLLRNALEEIFGVIKNISGFMEQFSSGFYNTLNSLIGILGGVAQGFAAILSNSGPLGEIVGTILAMAVAFKGLMIILGPIIASMKILFGMAALARGLSAASIGLAAAFGKIAMAGGPLAGIATRATTGFAALGNLLAGPVVAGIAAVVAGFMAWKAQGDAVTKHNEAIADSANNTAESYNKLADAFRKAEGVANADVFAQMSSNLGTLREDLDAVAGTKTGFMADAGAMTKDMFDIDTYTDPSKLFGSGDAGRQNEEIDKAAEKARKAKVAIDELGISNDDLAQAVGGTDGEFKTLVSNLAATSNGGAEAIAKLNEQRAAYLTIQQSMENIGPAALKLGNAVKVIADQSSTAAEKMDALTSAMEALGLLQVTEVEAFSRLNESLAQLEQELQAPLGPAEQLGDALVNGVTGALNATNPAAQELWRRLSPLSENLRSVAAAGGDVDAAWQSMLPQLEAVKESTGLNDDQWQALLKTIGLTPGEITTMMKLQGADAATQELFVLQTRLNEIEPNKPITVSIKDQNVRDQLRKIGADVQLINATTGEVKITVPNEMVKQQILGLGIWSKDNPVNVQVKPQVDEAAKKKAIDDINASLNNGVQKVEVGPTGAHRDAGSTADPGTLNSLAAQDKKGLGGGSQTPAAPAGQPEIAPGVPAPPPEVKTSIKIEGADQAKQQIAQITTTLVNIKDRVVRFRVDGIVEALGALNSVVVALDYVSTKSGRANFMVAGTDAAIGALNAVIVALNNVPEQTVKHFMIEGTDPAIGAVNAVKAALDNVNPTIDSLRANMAGFATAVQNSMNVAATAISNFVATALAPLDAAALQANASGQALGQGFADGIDSKTEAARAAANRLAQAAARPLPRSPALEGPFSGKGWTPFRGKKLAEGFAEGIDAGAPAATASSLLMAAQISDAMDSIRASFNMPKTSFGANMVGNPGGKMYYRDPEVSDEELRVARIERAEEKRKQAEESARSGSTGGNYARGNGVDYSGGGTTAGGLAPDPNNSDLIGAMTAIADRFGLQMTSGLREGDPGFHGSGMAADFSGDPAQMLAFAEFVNANFKPWTKELIYDPAEFQGKEIDEGQNVGSDFFGDGDHSDHVHWAVDTAPIFTDAMSQGVQQGAAQAPPIATQPVTIDPTSTSLSKDEVAALIIAEGQRQGASQEDILSALEAGIVESGLQNLNYGDRDSVGAFQQRNFAPWTNNGRNRMNVQDAAASYYEQLFANGSGSTPGQRAQSVQRSAYPDKYDAVESEARALLEANKEANPLNTSDPKTTKAVQENTASQEDTLTTLKKNDAELANALAVAESANSSDAQVIQALQTIDSKMATLNDTEKESLESQKSAVMTDRGLVEYDPFEGAIEDPMAFGINAAQTALGIYKTIESGLQNASQTAKLLIRGISNTSDVNSLVDGFQGLASTVSEIVSAVGSVVDIVASVAATAGAAIPGVGQVAAVIGGITGGIANVNAIIDLVQEVANIGGRIGGGILARLAGGENGQLQGNVRTLLDMNDNTIKTWSDRNATEKTVRGMPFQDSSPRSPNAAPAIENMNVYQGPGSDPAELMNNAMHTVKAHSTGVFAG